MTLQLFAFDFDKTITVSDTILPICRYLSKKFNSSTAFRLIQISYILFRLKLISSKKFKQLIVKYLLKNKSTVEIEKSVTEFYKLNFNELFNHRIINLITEQNKAGNKVIIVTSNLELFVRPVKNILSVDEVYGTRIKVNEGIVADEIEGENCSGIIKAKIVQQFKSEFQPGKIISYGDSQGDFEMFRISDESFIAEYKFDSLITKLLCRLKYLNGRICSDGLKVNFKNFQL